VIRHMPLQRSGRLASKSKRRTREERIYAKKRKAFLEAHPVCQVWLANNCFDDRHGPFLAHRFGERVPGSCDIHHKAGRTGGGYLDESTWMAVSREGHDWIHAHPKEAEARGWIVRAKPASAVASR
jgi:hypothetical protein